MTHNEVAHITVARADALCALIENDTFPDTMIAAIMEACSAGIVGEDSGVTVRRAEAYFAFLNK